MTAAVFSVGAEVGGNRLESEIGRGSMGVVYLATHLRLDRKVAVKVLPPERATEPEWRERFLHECHLAASIEHPNVIPIYDAGEKDGALFVVMRHVAGSDLRTLLARNGRLPLEEVVAVAEQAGGALDAAHARGLVHRDVKPANILIADSGWHVYLTDFGLARTIDAPGVTSSGSFAGTVDYCAPEQIEGRAEPRSDVYSLGCVVYHCLTGQPPFVRESEVAVVGAHLGDQPPAISELRPDLPRELERILASALAKQPAQRYPDCGSLTAALRGLLARNGPAPAAPRTEDATPRGDSVPIAAPVRVPPPPAEPPASLPEPPRRGHRRLLAAAGVLIALVAAGAVAAVILTRDGGTADPPGTAQETQPAWTRTRPDVASLARRQQAVTELVRSVRRTSASVSQLRAAGDDLEATVLAAQGFAETLTRDGRVMPAYLNALRAHEAYARSLADLPADASSLTKRHARSAIQLAQRAQVRYAQLEAAAPSLPAVKVDPGAHLRLLDVFTPPPPPKPSTPAPVTPAPTPTTTTPAPSGATSDADVIRATVLEHWRLINLGSYDAAYNLFTQSFMRRSTRGPWVRDKLRDRPQSSAIDLGGVRVSGSYATIWVHFRTRGSSTSAGNTGCNEWRGTYQLGRELGQWKIEKSQLVRTPRSCAGFTL